MLIVGHKWGTMHRCYGAGSSSSAQEEGLLSSGRYTEDVSSRPWVGNDDSCGVGITGAETTSAKAAEKRRSEHFVRDVT